MYLMHEVSEPLIAVPRMESLTLLDMTTKLYAPASHRPLLVPRLSFYNRQCEVGNDWISLYALEVYTYTCIDACAAKGQLTAQ